MKIYTAVLLFAFIILCSMQAKRREKIVLFGDSITQAGVNPGGYIDILQKQDPGTEFIGSGIGGNKIYDLYLRLETDVLARNPDVVVVYVGVNDVWHKQTHQTGTDPDKFVAFYNALIRKMKTAGIRVLICTPAVIGEKTDFSNPQDGDLNAYSELIRSIAVKNDLKLIDLRKAFLEYNFKNNIHNKESGILTTDRVHLNTKGNQLVAELIAEALK